MFCTNALTNNETYRSQFLEQLTSEQLRYTIHHLLGGLMCYVDPADFDRCIEASVNDALRQRP